jgi:hypothetical protein
MTMKQKKFILKKWKEIRLTAVTGSSAVMENVSVIATEIELKYMVTIKETLSMLY